MEEERKTIQERAKEKCKEIEDIIPLVIENLDYLRFGTRTNSDSEKFKGILNLPEHYKKVKCWENGEKILLILSIIFPLAQKLLFPHISDFWSSFISLLLICISLIFALFRDKSKEIEQLTKIQQDIAEYEKFLAYMVSNLPLLKTIEYKGNLEKIFNQIEAILEQIPLNQDIR
jgi:hypothetical protein